MFEEKVWIMDNPYVDEGEREIFNKYGEDLSYNRMECHFVYESDSTPMVSNKRKFDNREQSSIDTRNSFGLDGLVKVGMNDGPR